MMARQDHPSASNSKKAKLQTNARSFSPGEVVDTVDPGDETQQRYRYQHAYGVILLAAAIRKEMPYVAILCEHHEDLVGEREDGYYDAYQIKTQLAENGRWHLSKEPLKDSIKRFVALDQEFPEKFNEFYFVSNVNYENSISQNKVGRSPIQLLKAVQSVAVAAELMPPFDKTIEALCTHCKCGSESLFAVLKKLKLVKGPGLESFEAEIAQDHLHCLPTCSSWPVSALALLRDDLIAQIYQSSSLSVDDPSRHWHSLYGEDHRDPWLRAKRITVESIVRFIDKNRSHFLKMVQVVGTLSERLEETLRLYLQISFSDDQFAKLDQTGETDQDNTPLRQVFVDLELKSHGNPIHHRYSKQGQLLLFETSEQETDALWISSLPGQEKVLSAMDCLLREVSPRMVIIGGPGQGKSTLGQYLAQVHRALHLHCEEKLYRDVPGKPARQKKFKPKTLRIPFRIVLKYFAQWLADGPTIASVEAYLAEQIGKVTSRPGDISAVDIQEIAKYRPILVIFDGLDEVTESELRARMLRCVGQFLERAEVLDANLLVLATSRPTGYSGQFNPEEYWHLELQPMSINIVHEYAASWIKVKVALEEQRRVQDTLQECLREDHTRLLLTTPLQVTIVLLIIKDGGRPSAQREALFQQYWDTILRREKAKFKEIIRTDDTILFNLHAYLGYILHQRATNENVRTLLTGQDFEELVYGFLRKDDKYSSETMLRHRATQMVQDAGDRLVLLVAPEPGLFGFELRSLQEFFAGAYLTQTARDTDQRFERFRAIARFEHWHNVALFFAGRIVRNYSGEAEKILIDGCHPVDREKADRYLRRGAWLALDIAADGIFANNRNLQYSILEYALTILDYIITPEEYNRMASSLKYLTLEDRQDMLKRILEQKINSLPLSHQSELLRIYAQFVGPQPRFIEGLEALLASNQTENTQNAIALAFQYQVDPSWIARQIEKNWGDWIAVNNIHSLKKWWLENKEHVQAVMLALSVSRNQVDALFYTLLSQDATYGKVKSEPFELLENPQTLSDQVIVFLQSISILEYIMRHSDSYRIYNDKTAFVIFAAKISHENNLVAENKLSTIKNISQLMEHSELSPLLRACLWVLYWYFYEPSEANIVAVLEESNVWNKKKLLPEFFWDMWLSTFSPLLGLVLKNQFNNDQDTVKRWLPYLNKLQENAFSQQIYAAIEKLTQQPSFEPHKFMVDFYSGEVINYPDLADIPGLWGIDAIDIIKAYLHPYYERSNEKELSAQFIQYTFTSLERIINQSQKVRRVLQFLIGLEWSVDLQTLIQGRQLLTTLIGRLHKQPDILAEITSLFLKLLIFDPEILSLAPSLFLILSDKKEFHISIRMITHTVTAISSECLISLANFIEHKDLRVQQGAFIFWEQLVKTAFSDLPPSMTDSLQQKLISIRLDWQLGFALLKMSDEAIRKRGIMLLTLSTFPVAEKRYRDEILQALTKAHDIGEIAAWISFLKRGSQYSQAYSWQPILESILDHSQFYTRDIVLAAKKCYITSMGDAGPGIIGDKKALGLFEES